jgi:hypothetical protein
MSNFIYYKSGVFSCPSTTDEQLNHGVEVVGYDASGNFIIKNSWGRSGGSMALRISMRGIIVGLRCMRIGLWVGWGIGRMGRCVQIIMG